MGAAEKCERLLVEGARGVPSVEAKRWVEYTSTVMSNMILNTNIEAGIQLSTKVSCISVSFGISSNFCDGDMHQ